MLTVSVIVPSKNRREYLSKTIDSILGQDYKHIECIVIDGESTDGSIDILKGYGERIRLISEPDRSAADAINKGWRMSRGEILAWLNADDTWETPSAVSKVIELFENDSEADIIYGDCGRIDAAGNKIGMCSYMRGWNLEHAIEHCEHGLPQPAAFIRRRAIEKVGMLDPNLIFMDRDLWYRVGLTGKILYVPELLANARDVPSYWLKKGNGAANDCVRIMCKIVKDSNLPVNLKSKRKRIISNAYLRGIDYAYNSNKFWATIFSFLVKACIVDISNSKRAFQRIMPYVKAEAKESFFWKCFDFFLKPIWFWARPDERKLI
ncbi:TPA: hypothetical protein DEF17_04105 [bacterium]|nr:MAG: hypothetical protein AUJ18_03710 [Candidatus Hydrogenedentes bacterium CG1_02_42_14]HBW47100.1 hypothetical protein [bacterium]